MLPPKTDVVSEISINHVLIISHFSQGRGWCGVSYVVLVSTYVLTKMGPFLRVRFPFQWII